MGDRNEIVPAPSPAEIDLRMIAHGLKLAYPATESTSFDDLLRAIDDADEAHSRSDVS